MVIAVEPMPKDADFNVGNIKEGRTSVEEYAGKTRGLTEQLIFGVMYGSGLQQLEILLME